MGDVGHRERWPQFGALGSPYKVQDASCRFNWNNI